MGKLSASGINAQAFVNYQKDWYDMEVKGASVAYTQKTGGTMVVIDWKPFKRVGVNGADPTAANPSTVREWIMVDGVSPTGEPYRTDKWFDRLDALKIKRDYKCCGQMGSSRPFVIKEEDGKYYCPHCGHIADADCDVNEDKSLPWTGLKARGQLTIEKMRDSDEERNRINRVVPLP